MSPTCKIAIIPVKRRRRVRLSTYSPALKQFQFNQNATNATKGANGVSISVTIGGTAATISAVTPFTVQLLFIRTRRSIDGRPATAGPSQQAIASCYDA